MSKKISQLPHDHTPTPDDLVPLVDQGTGTTVYTEFVEFAASLAPYFATAADVATVQYNLDVHESDYTNPHNTTAVQLGLGNVDNTSDANKPISTATQTALDAKVTSVSAGTGISVDNTDPNNPIVSATGSGIGDVVGPSSSTNGSVALFDGTTGKLIKDGGALGSAAFTESSTYQAALGFTPENVANKSTDTSMGGATPSDTLYPSQKAVHDYVSGFGTGDVVGPSSATSDNLAAFDGTTGKLIKDSGVSAATIALKQPIFCGIDATTPIGASDISIDYSTRVLTITPPLGHFHYYTDGSGVSTKHTVTGAISFPAFTDTSGIWYFYFDAAGTATVTQTAWTDLSIVAPVYRILWNATLSGSAKAITENIETHENTISCVDHEWKHKYGAVWIRGATLASTALASGAPNASGVNTCVGLTSLTNLDDNLNYTITNSTGGLIWQQDLGNTTPANITTSNGALFEVRYDNAGLQYILPATRFPFDWDSGTNIPNYITAAGVRTPITSTNFFVYFVFTIQDPRNGKPCRIISAPNQYTSIANARAVTWTDIQNTYTTINDNEVRPLYRLIFEYRSSYDAAVKYSVLREVQDLRKAAVTSTTTASGSLPASSITVVPTTTLTSTNVQSALTELDEKTKKIVQLTLNGSTALTASDKAYARIPVELNGAVLTSVGAMVKVASTSGNVVFTVKRGSTSMLTTNITVEAGEYDSTTAATQPVIDTANDDVSTADQIEVAVSSAGASVTYAAITLTFTK